MNHTLTNALVFALLFFFSLPIIYAQHLPYEQKIPGTELSIDLVPIPGGTFQMGSSTQESHRNADEGPVHQVEIAPFWMAKFEITWDLYRLFIEREIDDQQKSAELAKEVSLEVDAVTAATIPYIDMSFGMGMEGHPAVNMTQLAAAKFCEWLSAMTGHFYRLPTEAEWEYACRAGTQTAYHFGDDPADLEQFAWFEGNSPEGYQKVGLKKPNPWGLHDMHGNVTEWTLDQYFPESYAQFNDPTTSNPFVKPTKTYPKVTRGGAWTDGPEQLRSAARKPSSKKWKMRDPQIPKSLWWHTDAPFVGFRIIRPVKTPTAENQSQYWGE